MKKLCLVLFCFVINIACKKEVVSEPLFTDIMVGNYDVTDWDTYPKGVFAERGGSDGKMQVRKEGNFLSIVALPLGENNDWYDFPKFNYKEKIYVTPRDNVQLFLASSKKDTLFESYIGADVVAKEKGITRLLVYIHYVDSQGKTYKVNAEKIGK